MLLRLVATFVLAIGAAGIVIMLNRYVFKGRLPRWVLPVAVAFAIIIMQVIEEYSWYPRTSANFTDSHAVLQERTPRQIWRPWSFIWPSVTNVTVVNKDNLKTLDDNPNIQIGYLTSLSSLGASSDAIFAFDCEGERFGPFTQDINNIPWADMSEYSAAICSD